MSYARQMLDTYHRTLNLDADMLAAAIDALSDCVQACNADNAADLWAGQALTEMVTCIRLCLELRRYLRPPPRGSPAARRSTPPMSAGRCCRPCVAICKSCGDGVRAARPDARALPGHAPRPRRRCEQACRELLNAMK